MPTPTYTPLANVTLASTATEINFTNIPATYRDLIVTFQARGSTTIVGRIRLNANTGNNYSWQRMSGNGSTATAAAQTSQSSFDLTAQATARTGDSTLVQINIMDYSATDKHKTLIWRADNAAVGTDAFAGRFALTDAITQVRIFANTGSWAIGTTANLYGVIA